MRKTFKNSTMRIVGVLVLAFLFTSCSYYTLSLQAFKEQFSDSLKYNRIYCTNKHNEPVWLETNNTILQVLKTNESKPTDFYISSILYKDNFLTGQPINNPTLQKNVPIDSVLSIRIKVIFPKEVKYFDVSKCIQVAQQRNDSINATCLNDSEIVILVKPFNGFDPSSDSIALCRNTCYSVEFKDNVYIKYGVITQITPDSLYITNSFNQNTAKQDKIPYKTLKYSINDIKAVNIYEGDGIKFQSLGCNEYNFIPLKISNMFLTCPYWYDCDKYSGEIWFYRNWLIQNGVFGIREINGKIYW